MGDKSKIQWTNATWNPSVGCTRVSAGCDHCYAFQLHDQRHVAWKRGRWDGAPVQYHQPFSKVQVIPSRLDQPIRWRKPRRIFVNSLSDLFHKDIDTDFIAQVFAVMAGSEQHVFQILTKRPERMRELMGSSDFIDLVDWHMQDRGWCSEVEEWPLPNVWLGVSIENEAAAKRRIPLLQDTEAAVRFLSCEPLIDRVDLTWRLPIHCSDSTPSGWRKTNQTIVEIDGGWQKVGGIDWVIVGGESGPHARPMDVDWAIELRDECAVAEVPFFFKQTGEVLAREWGLKDRHGGDESEWPYPWPREYPKVEVTV